MIFDNLSDKAFKGKRDDRARSRRRMMKHVVSVGDQEKIDDAMKIGAKVRGWLTWWGARSTALFRHLNSKIGQPYDTVYSDLCKNFTKKDHRYLLDHALNFLIVREDQHLWDNCFYVNAAGILCKTKKRPRYRYNKQNEPLLTNGRFIKIDNIWYEVVFSDVCDNIVDAYWFLCQFERRIQRPLFEKSRFDYSTDFLRRAELDAKVTRIINDHFGGRYPVKILQINKRAIRKNGLV